MDRARRRELTEKHKRRVRRMFKYVWHQADMAEDGRFVGIYAKTRQVCSCQMCKRMRYKRNRIRWSA